MKGDFSRQTFDPRKHYSDVRMQQGRVQLDADWNERGDIINYRAETTALDIIGGCGGPLHHAGFGIVTIAAGKGGEAEKELVDPAKAESDKKKPRPSAARRGDFLLGAGRYYVDGILCENEQDIAYSTQPDLPGAPLPGKSGLYLLYLDVWQRHLTALDDPRIREIALGGPDTATRVRTIWQAKLWPLTEKAGNCISAFGLFKKSVARKNGTLNAATAKEKASDDPCIVPPSAGFRGLENQLYRVEIHDGGKSLDVSGAPAGEKIDEITGTNQARMSSGGKWEVGTAVEIYPTRTGSNRLAGTLAYVTDYDKSTDTLSFDSTLSGIDSDDEPFVRPVGTTFKWSRDNGIVVSLIEKINPADKKITVESLGPDETLGFSVGQWVEISDDAGELNGLPGQLAQIADVNSTTREITLKSTPGKLANNASGVNPARAPKLRRWDGVGAVKFNPAAPGGWLDLEDGVQVQFDGGGEYRPGDFWLITARTATADVESGHIEWPVDAARKPLPQPPLGIEHHYCPLAIIDWNPLNNQFDADDCRSLFPPITELVALHYISGDGQEARPTLVEPKPEFVPLLHPIMVGVSNGRHPVAGARVRFDAQPGNGKIFPDAAAVAEGRGLQIDDRTIVVKTDADGLAACEWHLANTGLTSQQVVATLRNVANQPVHLPIRFNANLSVAAEVAYQPGECDKLAGVLTVQAALDQLCQLIGVNDEPGIHVKSVFTLDDSNNEQPFTPLENDSDVDFEALATGLMVQCDESLFINSLRGKPTCFVTLEMPYPFNSVDRRMWSESETGDGDFPVIGFNPLILDGDTQLTRRGENGDETRPDPSQIVWRPTSRTSRWLRNQLFEMIRELNLFSETRQGRVLAHLTLKGNFIWSDKDPELYLDGQAFGVRDDKDARTALRLPSGDGKRGGDFEMWFWLVTYQLELDPQEVNVGQESTGVVRLLSGPAPEGGAIIQLDSNNPGIAQPNARSVTIKAGETSAQFPISTKAAGAALISSRYAGVSRSQTLTVNSGTMRVNGVRLLATDGVFDTSDPQVLAVMENPSDKMTVPSSAGFDVIEVTFSVPPNVGSIVTGKTFIVRDARSNTISPLPGRIIQTAENVVRWGATQGVPSNEYEVVLVSDLPGAQGIVAKSGTRLDGEPTQLPSGDGTQGGNFNFRLTVDAPPVEIAPPLKVARLRFLQLNNGANDQNPIVLFDMQTVPRGGTVPLNIPNNRLNCIEVFFTGAPVEFSSIVSGSSLIVAFRAQTGALQILPGHVVATNNPNVVRWISGPAGQVGRTSVPRGTSVVTLVGEPPRENRRAITSTQNRRLDGEPTQLPSGNNVEGGDFNIILNITPAG